MTDPTSVPDETAVIQTNGVHIGGNVAASGDFVAGNQTNNYFLDSESVPESPDTSQARDWDEDRILSCSRSVALIQLGYKLCCLLNRLWFWIFKQRDWHNGLWRFIGLESINF